MWLTEQCDFYRRARHWGRRRAEHWRQRISRTFADRDADADRNVFVGIFAPRYRLETGEDLSVGRGECAATAGATIRKEGTTNPPALPQRRQGPRILHFAATSVRLCIR